MRSETIYLDHNATTPVAPEVYEAMVPYLTREFFNPSSMYSEAQRPAHAMTKARSQVASLLGDIGADQIVFTGCATESNNHAVFGCMRANPKRRHVVTSAVEHPSVLEVCRAAEREGCEVTYLPVNGQGMLDIRDFVRSLRPDTLLVTLMHANNETGVLFPIEELSRITKETDPNIVFHTDATQTMGKLPIDLLGAYAHVDLLSFSGHKMYAPKGVGVLYIKRGTRIRPFLVGGHQENGRRAGTENVAGIVALGKACELAQAISAEDAARIHRLRDRLENSLEESIPCLQINGKQAPRMGNTTNLSCHYIEGEAILYQLSEQGICASSGSACTSGSLDPSHVLKAMQIPFTALHGSIRFSLGRYTTAEQIERVIAVFPGIVARLRRLSPYWNQETNAPKE